MACPKGSKEERMESSHIVFSIASLALMGCASNSQERMAKLADGREVDEFKYSSFQELDDELKSRQLDDIDCRTERELIPKGGKLFLLEKKHYDANPVVHVSVSDGSRSFKCDESEVSRTVVTPGLTTPGAFVMTKLGVYQYPNK